MNLTLLLVGIIGVFVGIITNVMPMWGNNTFNFALALMFAVYDSLAKVIGLPQMSISVLVFAWAYIFGTFGAKLLRFTPIAWVIGPFGR